LAAVTIDILLLESVVHIDRYLDEPDKMTERISDKQRQQVPTNLLASFSAAVIYGAILVLLSYQEITIHEAGAVSMVTRGWLRLATRTFELRISGCLLVLHTTLAGLVLAWLIGTSAVRMALRIWTRLAALSISHGRRCI
jgi:hypothetical protein